MNTVKFFERCFNRKSKAITNLKLQKQGTSVRIIESWPTSDYGHGWRAKFRRVIFFFFILTWSPSVKAIVNICTLFPLLSLKVIKLPQEGKIK